MQWFGGRLCVLELWILKVAEDNMRGFGFVHKTTILRTNFRANAFNCYAWAHLCPNIRNKT